MTFQQKYDLQSQLTTFKFKNLDHLFFKAKKNQAKNLSTKKIATFYRVSYIEMSVFKWF